MWSRHKERYIDQWDRMKSLEINFSIYGQIIFDKGTNSYSTGKKSFQQMAKTRQGYPKSWVN